MLQYDFLRFFPCLNEKLLTATYPGRKHLLNFLDCFLVTLVLFTSQVGTNNEKLNE